MSGHYTVYGALGSPYSMKVRAAMRYRRLPHVWTQLTAANRDSVMSRVPVPVIPVVAYPDGTWRNDSTPVLLDLEARYTSRRLLPDAPAHRFFALLLEDMADEWGTKFMFHYRWWYARDRHDVSRWIAYDTLAGQGEGAVEAMAQAFGARQVGRMALVGCTEQNKPLIEETAEEVLRLLNAIALEGPYLFGTRPSIADFSWMGQLSQLASDPTPEQRMREIAPYAFRWLAQMDDAGGLEGGEWRPALQPATQALLRLCAEIYLPFLLANAEAAAQGAETFTVKLRGRPYAQGTFKYQVKCLKELRAAWTALGPDGQADAARLAPGLDLGALRG